MPDGLYDVIIIGSGPAGLTAAIYARRSGLETLVVGGQMWGGQLMLTGGVENYPGFPDGILGPELMSRMRRQAKRLGVKFVFENATSVDFSGQPFKVNVGDRGFESRAVIAATGASTKWLGLPAEQKLLARGVSTCATCDAPFFREKKVVVVGGGDTALDEALTLANHAREVTIVHRRDSFRACKMLQERVFASRKIKVIWNSVVEGILGEAWVKGVRLKNVQTGELTTLVADGVFIAIGNSPNTDVFKGHIELDEFGYVVVRDGTRTSVNGVFAAGDDQDPRYKQAITSAGAGCKAALDVVRYLQEHPM